jgi:outer membrane protein assembly factor BamB
MNTIAFPKKLVVAFCLIAGLTITGKAFAGKDEGWNYITNALDKPLVTRNNAQWKIFARDIPSAAMTCDHKRNIYVADDYNRCIYKFAPNGSKTIWWKGKGNQLPSGLAIDADDNLYLAEREGGAVIMVNSLAQDRVLISGLNKLSGLTITPDGSLIVCEEGSSQIIEVTLKALY